MLNGDLDGCLKTLQTFVKDIVLDGERRQQLEHFGVGTGCFNDEVSSECLGGHATRRFLVRKRKA